MIAKTATALPAVTVRLMCAPTITMYETLRRWVPLRPASGEQPIPAKRLLPRRGPPARSAGGDCQRRRSERQFGGGRDGRLKAGARGYLTKNADRREISQALHSAAAGHTILPPEVTAMLLAGTAPTQQVKPPIAAELPDDLTPREAEVLRLLAAGLSNGEIARDLVISEHTVKTHINHVFSKTGSRDRAQAIRYAHQHQLV
jgi:DNA-binding CsgD family transcriptional regulator